VGKPRDVDDYVPIQVGEWARRYGTIYVPKEIWARLRPVSQDFVFYIEDTGRFTLEFDLPVGRLQP
jgi:hypothetical protein